MTKEDFNNKYKQYIENGYRGLTFDIPAATIYLDKQFETLIYVPHFKFAEITLTKNKFVRIKALLSSEIILKIEQDLEKLIKNE